MMPRRRVSSSSSSHLGRGAQSRRVGERGQVTSTCAAAAAAGVRHPYWPNFCTLAMRDFSGTGDGRAPHACRLKRGSATGLLAEDR